MSNTATNVGSGARWSFSQPPLCTPDFSFVQLTLFRPVGDLPAPFNDQRQSRRAPRRRRSGGRADAVRQRWLGGQGAVAQLPPNYLAASRHPADLPALVGFQASSGRRQLPRSYIAPVRAGRSHRPIGGFVLVQGLLALPATYLSPKMRPDPLPEPAAFRSASGRGQLPGGKLPPRPHSSDLIPDAEPDDRVGDTSQLRSGALTVIVPAYNEAAFVGATVESILEQTRRPEVLVVVDDGSTDDTGDVALGAGANVLRPPANTGSKAGAQNFALTQVETEFVMAIDADTTLAEDAIERLLPALEEPRVAAACGYVLPRRVRSICERGRYIEYLFAFSFGKPIQDYFTKPLISSGCFSVYRTAMLREAGGWPARTLAEDMDLTWTFYRRNRAVRFVPEAVCYPVEPQTFYLMGKQLRRWSHGFLQNARLHWRGLLRFRYLRLMLAVALWDSIVASLAYIVLFPALAILVSPWFLVGYLVDAGAVLVPVLAGALPRRELGKALASYPSFFVLRVFNAAIMLRAVWNELVLRRSFLVYEKGH